MRNVVIIWDELAATICYFVVQCKSETHYKQLLEMNRAYINSDGPFPSMPSTRWTKIVDRLNDLMFDSEGNKKLTKLIDFPVEEVKAGASVIVCGFLP